MATKKHPLKGKPKSAAHRKAISEGLKRHHANKGKWIKDAIKHPGALRRKAKRAGLIKGAETLTRADLKKLEKSKNATTRKEARLAETLSKLPRYTGPRTKKKVALR